MLKLMRTAKTKTAQKKRINPLKAGFLLLMALLLAATPLTDVYADSYDEQIRALERDIAGYQNEAGRLRTEADTLQNKVNALSAEKGRLQAQIDLNTAKIRQLEQQIIETQAKIEQQKTLLGNNLVALYLDNSVTPLEMLASSKTISEYIDKQEYRDTIRSRLQESIAQVKQLEKDLNKQKKDTEAALADQKTQRDELAAKENEQAILLAQTQGQEAAYQNMVKQSNTQISSLREQQRLANLRWGGNISYGPACGGGYSGPWNWCNAPLDAYVDNWGMYTRECVSYTAFKVWASGRHMPYWGGRGNANQWDDNARAAGMGVDSNPKAGDVAVWPIGYYGHVMYVEAVRPNGDIYISEYNFDWTGRYSERTISKSTWQAQGFQFIHF
jgi:surface antigen/peptidoglycan hydrolase CwlO-like protein